MTNEIPLCTLRPNKNRWHRTTTKTDDITIHARQQFCTVIECRVWRWSSTLSNNEVSRNPEWILMLSRLDYSYCYILCIFPLKNSNAEVFFRRFSSLSHWEYEKFSSFKYCRLPSSIFDFQASLINNWIKVKITAQIVVKAIHRYFVYCCVSKCTKDVNSISQDVAFLLFKLTFHN